MGGCGLKFLKSSHRGKEKAMSRSMDARVEERDALLSSAHEMLLANDQVVAAWMYGSLGRGTEDGWSDLDIWVVLEDDAYPGVVENRRAFARQLGEPIIFVEAPQNGPPDGMYLMAVHDAPTGPHMIDWRFQPVSSGWKPDSKRMLIERRPLPIPDREIPFCGTATWKPTTAQDDENKAAMFLIMTLVQAKTIARNPSEPGMKFEDFILNLLREVLAFRGLEHPFTEHPDIVAHQEKLGYLSQYVEAFLEAAPEHGNAGEAVLRFVGFVVRARR